MIRVGIIGVGTIGKRVADAVSKQNDMVVAGVADVKPHYEVLASFKKGFNIFTLPDKEKQFLERGVKVKGYIDDLLKSIDVVVDATPAGIGFKNRSLYERYGLKAIFQGGEEPSVADVSFNALANYVKALGKRFVRVVSCNTTGLIRVIYALSQVGNIENVRAVIVRRGADPKEVRRGPINSIVLDPPAVPSHHAIDVKTVLGDIDIVTMAVAVPTTLAHLHNIIVRFKNTVSKDMVLEQLMKMPRILLVSATKTDIGSTAEIIELSRDLGRPRYDMYENIIWEETVHIANGKELMLMQAVHQEAIVIPENIDAIRAVTEAERDPMRSIEKTDKALNVVHGLWP